MWLLEMQLQVIANLLLDLSMSQMDSSYTQHTSYDEEIKQITFGILIVFTLPPYPSPD